MRAVTLTWPGGEHPFALPIGALRALQEARDAGPEELLNRIRLGTWRVDDLTQVLRWGLVGGGAMDAAEAARLVTGLFDLHPAAQFKLAAFGVLEHALFGPADDPAGKPEGVKATRRESGVSRASTGTGRSSASPRGKSTK